MRLRVEVSTSARKIPWQDVLRPGRALLYDMLTAAAPDLGRELHQSGRPPYGMVPFGHGAPTFPSARKRRGVYAVGGAGYLEVGSPVLDVVTAWAEQLPTRAVLDWGGVALQVRAVHPVDPPAFESGRAQFRTTTPVVLKGSGRAADGVRTTRQAWLLPTEPEFPAYFAQSLRRKATTLELDHDVTLDAITWVGGKRSFAVKDGAKPGAPLAVQLSGPPATLQALWSWGLGQANAAGFGWVAS